MRTDLLFVDNVRALLDAHGMTQRELSHRVGHHETWLSKILKKQRGVRLGDVDKIADFFGLNGYQLLTPGIARAAVGPRRRSAVALPRPALRQLQDSQA